MPNCNIGERLTKRGVEELLETTLHTIMWMQWLETKDVNPHANLIATGNLILQDFDYSLENKDSNVEETAPRAQVVPILSWLFEAQGALAGNHGDMQASVVKDCQEKLNIYQYTP